MAFITNVKSVLLLFVETFTRFECFVFSVCGQNTEQSNHDYKYFVQLLWCFLNLGQARLVLCSFSFPFGLQLLKSFLKLKPRADCEGEKMRTIPSDCANC